MLVNIAFASEATNPVQLLGLDWKLFIAQLFNFGVVLFVLFKWVLGPIRAKIRERERQEKELADNLKAVKERVEALKKESDNALKEAHRRAQEIIEDAQNLSQEIFSEAQIKSLKQRDSILSEASRESDKLKLEALKSAKNSLAGLVIEAAGKVLGKKITGADSIALAQEAIREVENG